MQGGGLTGLSLSDAPDACAYQVHRVRATGTPALCGPFRVGSRYPRWRTALPVQEGLRKTGAFPLPVPSHARGLSEAAGSAVRVGEAGVGMTDVLGNAEWMAALSPKWKPNDDFALRCFA